MSLEDSVRKSIQTSLENRFSGKIDSYGNIVFIKNNKKYRFKILERVVRYEHKSTTSGKWFLIKSISIKQAMKLGENQK